MKRIIYLCIYFIDCLVPKDKKRIAFVSFPDVSDNSFAMFKYLFLKYREDGLITSWLLNDLEKKDEYKDMIFNHLNISTTDTGQILFVKKNSLMGFLHYFRSKYVFFTHGLYPNIGYSKKHVLINLWHGMPLKNIGLLIDSNNISIPISSYSIATSEFFQKVISKAFNLNLDSVIVSGLPRNDLLFQSQNTLSKFGLNKDYYKKIFLWTPTYRQATIGYSKIDGDFVSGLPVISNNYNELNNRLNFLDCFMVVKLHPMDILNQGKFEDFTNLLFLKNGDLEVKNCQLNELLGDIDVLLTDFSSTYIDFMLLNKPIGFVMDDMESFSKSRGFVIENPLDYMPGEFISSIHEFFDFLKRTTDGEDRFRDKRKEVNSIFNKEKTDFSQKLWIEILKRED